MGALIADRSGAMCRGMQRLAVRLTIRGRVQGVGYRWWAIGQARRLGLDGWVRNRQGGWVELLAAGTPDAVEAMIEACRRGPPAAEVASVEQSLASDEGVPGFRELPTA